MATDTKRDRSETPEKVLAEQAPTPLSYQIVLSGSTDSGDAEDVRKAFKKLVRALNDAGIPANGQLTGEQSGRVVDGSVVPGEILHVQAYDVILEDQRAEDRPNPKNVRTRADVARENPADLRPLPPGTTGSPAGANVQRGTVTTDTAKAGNVRDRTKASPPASTGTGSGSTATPASKTDAALKSERTAREEAQADTKTAKAATAKAEAETAKAKGKTTRAQRRNAAKAAKAEAAKGKTPA